MNDLENLQYIMIAIFIKEAIRERKETGYARMKSRTKAHLVNLVK